MSTVVVTDGEHRAALAVVRSVGRAGHRVIVCSSRSKCIAAASRFASTSKITPDPLLAPEEFVVALCEIITAHAASVLLPVTDASILAVLAHQHLLPEVLLPFPLDERFSQLSSKSDVLARAPHFGLRVPAQVILQTKDTLLSSLTSQLAFPLAVKPARSMNVSPASAMERSFTSYARDLEQLERVLERIPSYAYPVLLQERISGSGVGVFVLLWNGELLASFSHERLREKPPEGGVCVHGVSRSLPVELRQQAVALLQSYRWNGLAMVEFKERSDTGAHVLMEVNPRFWGSLQLAIDSGVDFPRILVDAMLGRELRPVLEFNLGVRTRWYWGEIDHLAALRRPEIRQFASGARVRSLLSTALDVLPLWRPGVRDELLRISDPFPFVRETLSRLRHW